MGADLTRRYTRLGLNAHNVAIHELKDRLKKVSLLMELPFKDLEQQCRAQHIYSSKGEVGRTYLVERLVAALWPSKANRPPPPRQPPRMPIPPPPRMTQYFQALQLAPSASLEDVKKA